MNMKIVCLGDSITYGFPYGPEYSWVSLTSKSLGIKIINKGENGDTTRFMAYRFKKDVLDEKPTHVIIMGGTNDAYVGEPINVFKDNMQTMSRKSLANGIIPILALPIPANDVLIESNLLKYRKWMIQYSNVNHINYFDLGPSMSDPLSGSVKNNFYMDDVHPSIDGYDNMAHVIQQYLIQNILSKNPS